MYIPKRYGESRVESCPFCGKRALVKNSQGIPVCHSHRTRKLGEMRCACGQWLELMSGKWGPYFRCTSCGNISFRKALEMNPIALSTTQVSPVLHASNVPDNRGACDGKAGWAMPGKDMAGKMTAGKETGAKKEIFVNSDELDFLY